MQHAARTTYAHSSRSSRHVRTNERKKRRDKIARILSDFSNLKNISGITHLDIRTLSDFPWAKKQVEQLLPGAGADAHGLVEIVAAASTPGGFLGGPSTFSSFISEQRALAPPCAAVRR